MIEHDAPLAVINVRLFRLGRWKVKTIEILKALQGKFSKGDLVQCDFCGEWYENEPENTEEE